MAALRTHPTRQTAYLNGPVLQFRHPWMPEKMLRFGVGKLPRVEHGLFLQEAQMLLDRAPKDRREAPSKIRQPLLDRYFRILEEAQKIHLLTIDPNGTIPERDNPDIFLRGRLEFVELKRKFEAVQAENGRLQTRIDELVRALNERTDQEKRTTLGNCWARFEERFACHAGTKLEERGNVLRRVRVVLEQLGWERRYGDIQKIHLIQA